MSGSRNNAHIHIKFRSMLYICVLLAGVFCVGSSASRECGLYLAKGHRPGQVTSVYAGKDYSSGDVIDKMPTLSITTKSVLNTQLFHSVFEAEEIGNSLIVFGTGMQIYYNDSRPGNVDLNYDSDEQLYFIDSENDMSASQTTRIDATRIIRAGEELIVGSESIDNMDVEVDTSRSLNSKSIQELEKSGHCLTDIYVKVSTIPMAGKGVFTKRAHKKGDVVSISPVLVLPKHEVQKTTNHSVLLNYCLCSENSDVALLPTGLGAMINHGGVSSNVEVKWHEWESSDGGVGDEKSMLEWSPNDLEQLDHAPLNIAYVATRDIAEEEELTMSYGESWEVAWTDYSSCTENDEECGDMSSGFRHSIEAGFFPASFVSVCIGRNVGFGRGVYAGNSFKGGSEVEVSPSLLISNDFAMSNQLQYFVYATDDDSFDAITFGTGMMYNSLDKESVEHEWEDENIPDSSSIYFNAHTTFPSFRYVSTKKISTGEEIFVNYGDDWFRERQKKLIRAKNLHNKRYSIAELEKSGHCLTDIYVKVSTIPMAGKGVFTKRAHKKGDVVSISPVLVLPKHEVQKTTNHSVLLNYCLCSENSDVALLPTGLGAMINHGGVSSNVEVKWHEWESSDGGVGDEKSMLEWSPNDLEQLDHAPLNIAYVATRDIAEEEELTMSYGESWEKTWIEHLAMLAEWNERYGDTGAALRPQFRHPILTPGGFYPAHFYGVCIGTNCDALSDDEYDFKGENRKHISEALGYADMHFLTRVSGNQCHG